MNGKELITYLLGELEKIKNMTMPKSLDDLTDKYYEIKEIAILAIHKAKSMKQETKQIEALEILTDLLDKSNVRKHLNINMFGHSQLERDIVTELTNWQKEKDRELIEQLLGVINAYMCYRQYSTVTEREKAEAMFGKIRTHFQI